MKTTDDLPGIEDLKSAGLLRKGQVLGGLAGSRNEKGAEDEEESDEGEFEMPDLVTADDDDAYDEDDIELVDLD